VKLFSKNLIVLRTVWNMSQLELAKKFGVVGPSYSRWENGTEPKYDTLVEIAKFFKISIDRLLTEELTPQTAPPRWGSREYPPQPEETAKAVEEPSMVMSEKVAALMGKVLERMDRLEQEHQRLRQALADKETK
jgi:transcriptional regulator with XRE-family HTH domain